MVGWTALLLGFYLFLRKSYLVPDTMTTFNIDQQFCRGGINLLGLDRAMMIQKYSGYQYCQQKTKPYALSFGHTIWSIQLKHRNITQHSHSHVMFKSLRYLTTS